MALHQRQPGCAPAVIAVGEGGGRNPVGAQARDNLLAAVVAVRTGDHDQAAAMIEQRFRNRPEGVRMRAAGMISFAASTISGLRTSKTRGASARSSCAKTSAGMRKGVPMNGPPARIACGPWARA